MTNKRKGVLEISTRTIKFYAGEIVKDGSTHQTTKKTWLIPGMSRDQLEERYQELYADIKKIISSILNNYLNTEISTCIITGAFTESPFKEMLNDSLGSDYPFDIKFLNEEEIVRMSYASYIQSEKQEEYDKERTDVFVEVSANAISIGLFNNMSMIGFHSFSGTEAMKDPRLVRGFDKYKEEFRGLLMDAFPNVPNNARLILSGGAAKAIIAPNKTAVNINGKTRTIEEINDKVSTILGKLDEGNLKEPIYTKLLSGAMFSVPLAILFEYFSLEKAYFSGYGAIESYYYSYVYVKAKKHTQHMKFKDLFLALSTGANVFISGPTGAGKSFAVKQCAKKLGLDFYFTGAVSNEYKLLGFMNASGEYVSTDFRKAYENGGLFLFDEVDASFPQPLLAFNAALSNDVMDFPDKQVKRHKNFHCVATANTIGCGADRQYVGRNQLDAAFLDRFIYLEWPYDESMEKSIVANATWTDRVIQVRKAIEKLGIRHIVSPRATVNGAALLKAGFRQHDVEDMVLWKGLNKSDIDQIKNNIE